MINKSIAKIEDNQFGGKNVFYKTRFFLVKSTFAKRFSSKCIFLLCSVRHRTRAVLMTISSFWSLVRPRELGECGLSKV